MKFLDKKEFIFDFDMTLVDTTKGSAYCYEKTFIKAGAKFCMSDLPLFLTEFLDVTYKRIDNPLISQQAFIDEFYRNSHMVMAEMSKMYADVKSVFKYLLSKNKRISIVTNKDRICVNKILSFHHLSENIFSCIVCCDDVEKHKPNPEALNLCIRNLQAKKSDCIYIGDSINDVIFANNAEILGIQIIRDNNTLLKENDIIFSLDDLLR